MMKKASIGFAATLILLSSSFAQEQDDVAEFNEAAERLRALLNEAAETGFVSMRGQEPPEEPLQSTEQSTDETLPEGEQLASEAPPKKDKTVRRSLRLDRAEAASIVPGQCTRAEWFNLDDFKEPPTYDDVYLLRNKLMSPRGEYDPEVGLKLAQSYLALSMPEEAYALSLTMDAPQVQFIGQLAQVVRGKGGEFIPELERYLPCSDSAGIWLAAAIVDRDPERSISYANEYVTEVGQLPPDLQFTIASKLGILAAEQEDYELAKLMLARMMKLGHDNDPAVLYLEALVGATDGEQASLDQLRYAAQVQGPYQARALIELGAMSETTPYKKYAKDLELVTAQYKGLDDGDLAKQMNIRFLAEEGRYQFAIDTTKKDFLEEGRGRAASRDIIANIMLRRLQSDEPEERFKSLTHYVYNLEFFFGYGSEEELRFRAASSALEFELPKLLVPLQNDFTFIERRGDLDLVLAKAAMIEHHPDQASQIASAYQGRVEFDMIRVDASVIMGDPETALALMDAQPQTPENLEKSAMIAWRFGLWDRAKDYYAGILLTEGDEAQNDRYNLAAYMSGEQGGFFNLKPSEDLLEIQELFDSYKDEQVRLKEYLRNG